MPLDQPKIIVTRRLPAPIEQRLVGDYGAMLSPGDRQLSADELRAALAECDILLCTLTDPLTRHVLMTPDRRAVMLANFSVGVNHIDLAAAREAGLVVTNTPGVLTEDTADLTMLLILAGARRAFEGDRELRSGQWTGWRPTHLLGTRVAGKTLGIVGFGRIGQAVARRAALGFGMRVLYHSRRQVPDEARASGAEWRESLETLLRDCDFVSLHCPATPETHHLINTESLAAMRSSAWLVNTSRGDVVDEAALVDALRAAQIAGAALDVYEHEPRVPPALLALPNVVTLPHLGSATMESRVAMGERTLLNIAAFMEGRKPPDAVVSL
jgi:glyoxylate reductase